MAANLTHQLIEAHRVDGAVRPGEEIALRVDQTLTQDATGTLVMLALDALGVDRVRTEVSAQYVDHNLIQQDHRNPDDHLFLESACRRFGVRFSPPGGGVSHPVHMQHFGVPGRSLLGSDSHTCAAGSLGMLAMGAGGLDVALAMAGEPYVIEMPQVWGIELTGALPPWVSAKDVILELLRRHGVSGGVGRILEYHGPGVATLGAMDRHVIANMGAELGATTSVFPSDEQTRAFLERAGRVDDWRALRAEPGAGYDVEDSVDLSALEPLIAKPTSPGNVVPVRECEGEPIYQAYVGSSANPGFRDFAAVAEIVRGSRVPPHVSLDINPTSRELLLQLLASGHLSALVSAGARVHQAGCNGCIGMGQAPASGRNSLRTVPRNFPDRSGTAEDSVFLCSPETAAASALRGEITDPRRLGGDPPAIEPPPRVDAEPPRRFDEAEVGRAELVMGPSIEPMPRLDPLPDALELPVLLAMGDDVSTDEILRGGARVLPHRSNLPKIAEFTFEQIDPEYPRRAREVGDHAVVAGENYGQGSSREHAALAPRLLGLRVAIARSFARIHRANLINYGVLPLALDGVELAIARGQTLRIEGLAALERVGEVTVRVDGGDPITIPHGLTAREAAHVRAGGRIAHFRAAGDRPTRA